MEAVSAWKILRDQLTSVVVMLLAVAAVVVLPPPGGLAGAGMVVVFIVGYVNAFNFMDGINGISAAQTIVAGVFWWALGSGEQLDGLSTGSAIVVGATLAFVPFNFPKARVFLGDVGSYFLGAWLAVLAVMALRADVTPEAVLAPLGIYLADTGATIARRVRRGSDGSPREHRGRRPAG